MERITACIMALMFPLLLGTAYIVRENGKEVGKSVENDGKNVTKYIDNNVREKTSPEIVKNASPDIQKQPSSGTSPFSSYEEAAVDSFFRFNGKPLSRAGEISSDMKNDILKVTTLGSKLNRDFCGITKMIGSGKSEEECVPEDLKFEYTGWRQDNPVEASDCYDVGRQFGNMSFDSIEDTIASLLLSEEDYKEWKNNKEQSKLKAKVDSLEAQVSDLSRRTQYNDR